MANIKNDDPMIFITSYTQMASKLDESQKYIEYIDDKGNVFILVTFSGLFIENHNNIPIYKATYIKSPILRALISKDEKALKDRYLDINRLWESKK